MPDRRTKIAAGIAVAAMLAGAIGLWSWQGRAEIDPDNPRQVALGRELYGAHCAACHGPDLKGELDWQIRRPTGELPAPPHDASGHTWHHSDEHLFAITKHGIARFAPPDYKTHMEGFVGRLTDAEIRAVLAYIKSNWPADIRARQEAISGR